MISDSAVKSAAAPHRIEIKLRDLNQLFNTMDPSPFVEKDLDADAEEFIVSWARECPASDPLLLTVHVSEESTPRQSDELVGQAVRNYFSYRAKMAERDLRQLLSDGRASLLIGLLFLCACLVAAQLLSGAGEETLRQVAKEGLEIVGWVAMWRPLEIYLYDWVPLRRRWKTFQKLGVMEVEIHRHGPADAAHPGPLPEFRGNR